MPTLPSVRTARATLDRSLRSDRAPFSPGRPPRRTRRRGRWDFLTALEIVAVIVMPAVFVRVAITLYGRGFGTATTMIGAVGIVMIALAALVTALAWRLARRRVEFSVILRWVALPAVLLWSGYSLLYLARANAKTVAVRDAYTSLHPVLRLALSSAIIADGDLVVTDGRRSADDYRRMGLPVFDRTMHYPQPDSWVHAIDVRTIGHGAVRNFGITWYFRAVGLRVVRHVGTADHLHVELPLARR